MDEEKQKERMKQLLGEIKRLQEVVKTGEEQKKTLIKELKARDSFIGKVKKYMGSDNFNTLLESFREQG